MMVTAEEPNKAGNVREHADGSWHMGMLASVDDDANEDIELLCGVNDLS